VDLPLTDADFRAFDNPARFKVFDAVHAAGRRGLFVAAPPAVDTGAARELPIVVASSVTALDAWALQLPRRTTLLALDPERDELYAGAAFPPLPGRDENDIVAPTPPPPPHDTAVYTEASCIDARSRLALPWGRGRVVLYALCFDRLSNAAPVTLGGPELPPLPERAPLPLPASARLGAIDASPGAPAGEIRFSLEPPGSIEGWAAPLVVAAPGPTLTVLAAVPRERVLLRRPIDLEGQPHLALDLAALFPGLPPERSCFYLASGGALAGPCRIPTAAARS